MSARVHEKTRSLALERSSSRVARVIDDDGEAKWKFCVHWSMVSLSSITQRDFVGMLQARRRIDQVDVYFLFERQRFCPSRTAGIVVGYPFTSVPA